MLAVGIEDIRREAGASPSSVYHLFEDKDAIMLALLVEVFDALFEHCARRVCATKSAEDAVKTLVDSHIEWIASHAAEGRFMYQATSLDGASLAAPARRALVESKAKGLAPIVEHLAPMMALRELPPWPVTVFDVVVLGPSHEALRRWLSGSNELDPAMLRALLPSIAWHSVRDACARSSTSA